MQPQVVAVKGNLVVNLVTQDQYVIKVSSVIYKATRYARHKNKSPQTVTIAALKANFAATGPVTHHFLNAKVLHASWKGPSLGVNLMMISTPLPGVVA